MRNRLLILVLALAGLVPQALAQNRAGATLYTRVDGSEIRAVVEFQIDKGWKLYHTDLGDENAVATPLTYTFGGVDAQWSELRLIEPETDFIDDPYLGTYTVDYHKGKAIGYAVGALAEGADGAGLTLALAGQTCDPSVCVPYGETVESKGAGADDLFAAFPTDLAAAGNAAPAEGEAAVDQGFDWEPTFPKNSKAEARLRFVTDGSQVHAVVEVVVQDGWHLYDGPTKAEMGPNEPIGDPTVLEFLETGPVEWSEPIYPESHGYPGLDKDVNDIEVQVLEGSMVFTIPGLLDDGADPEDLLDVELQIVGQTCNEGSCLGWSQELAFLGDGIPTVDTMPALLAQDAGGVMEAGEGGGTQGAAASAGENGGSPQEEGEEEEEESGMLKFLLQAVMWGFITLLMPCTYPMIPITISFFTKQADQRGGNVLPLSLAYGAGIVGMFVAIGVVVGPPIQTFANHPLFNLLIAGMFVFFALVLFGWVNLQPPAFLNNAAGKASSTGGLLGVFLMGLTLVITSFTCTAPFVGTLLASGANQGVGRTAIGMGLFGLTMATPFVLLSLFPGRMKKMPTAGAWMNTLKVFLGFVELAASLKFLSTADLGWGWGFLSKEVFLLAWGSIFLVAAAFLFGWINLKGEEDGVISPGRMVGATATFVFGTYSLFLIGGYEMDPLMTAFAPPYSTAPERAAGPSAGKPSNIVKDNYEEAVSKAKAEQKALLVNFTGFN